MSREITVINMCNGGKVPPSGRRDSIASLLKGLARHTANDLVSAYFSAAMPQFPLAIEIETINRCNNNCSFCPVNANEDPRSYELMDLSLVERIATELGAANYRGLLALFSNNEPLLDARIADICAIFRNRLKAAHIYMYTNGIMLTPPLYLSLFNAGLDELIIDNYSEKGELILPVKTLINEINRLGEAVEPYKARTRVFIRRKKEVLTNRGGSAPNKKGKEDNEFLGLRNASCVLPFIQMVVRPTGEVSLCCQDALGRVTIGDVSREGIHAVWNNATMKDIRTRLKMFGRSSVELCRGCDASIIYSAVLKRKIYGMAHLPTGNFRL
ncbi:MAG: radical SAM/SPASM domain-containing protein [Deltaproteobacteria bacterium]